MSYWVLLVWLTWPGTSIQIIEFKTEAGCEAAKGLIQNYNEMRAICVEIK